MDIMIIDFDAKFSEHIKKWISENSDSFKDMDEAELMMPEIYDTWLSSPQEFLSGKKPNEYFADFSAEDLVNLMLRYAVKNIGIPDPLLDAIISKKREALPHLEGIALNQTPMPEDVDVAALQIMVITLINEIDSTDLMKSYIRRITLKELDEGVAETMIDTIKQNAEDFQSDLIAALEETDSTTVKKRLLDILCGLPYSQAVYDELMSMFKSSGEKALYASYLGKYGNDAAIKTLEQALDWININYLDYIEIRNAIEELGGEVSHLRSFEGDKFYESLKEL